MHAHHPRDPFHTLPGRDAVVELGGGTRCADGVVVDVDLADLLGEFGIRRPVPHALATPKNLQQEVVRPCPELDRAPTVAS
ncbi:hypothetical protein NPS01_19910 [Nocardioides psychrotolerans]|nr:hypothetical protein NPS01_19910 [Nocardioides psychrotolerans]